MTTAQPSRSFLVTGKVAVKDLDGSGSQAQLSSSREETVFPGASGGEMAADWHGHPSFEVSFGLRPGVRGLACLCPLLGNCSP